MFGARGKKRPIRVSVLGLRGIPASWGGVERQCEEIYTRLARDERFRVTVYARSKYVDKGVREYKGVRVVRLPTINTTHLEAMVHTFLAALHMLFRRKDVIHVYSQGPCLVLPFVRALNPFAKVFFTCGGLDWQRKKWSGLASRIIHLGEYFSARLTHHRIMVSRELGRYYKERYNVATDYIPNGVTPRPGQPLSKELKQTHGLEDGRYFVFVGRLVPEKRIEDLIAAYAGKKREAKLAIVGGAAGREDYLEQLHAQAGDNRDIVFTGYCFGDDLARVFSSAMAYVSASELEGLPLTLLEALSYELPCIVSDIPPHREVIDQTGGILFPVLDVPALSRCLDRMEAMDAEEASRMGSRAAEAVSREYDWDLAVEALGRLYVKASGRGNREGEG